jgi:2'-5' RNA ligase
VKLQAPPDLFEVQRCIEEETARLGYPREKRSFKPHLTLGRVSRNANTEEVRRVGEVLESINVGFLGAMRVKYVHLFRSDIKPTGAVYTRLHTAELIPAQSEN